MSDPGIRLTDLPDLGAVTDDSVLAGGRVGVGSFKGSALKKYIGAPASGYADAAAASAGAAANSATSANTAKTAAEAAAEAAAETAAPLTEAVTLIDGFDTRLTADEANLAAVDTRVVTVEGKLPSGPRRHGRRDVAAILRAGPPENPYRLMLAYLDGDDAGKFDGPASAPFIERVTSGLRADVQPAVIIAGKFGLTPPRHGRQTRPLSTRSANSAGQPWIGLDVDRFGLLDVWQNEASKKRNTRDLQPIYAPYRMRETRHRLRRLALGFGQQYVLAIYGDSWTGAASYYVEDLTRALQAAYGNAGMGWFAFAWGNPADNLAGANPGTGAIVDPTWDGTNGTNGTVYRSANWTKSYTAASPDGSAVMSSTPGAYFEWVVAAPLSGTVSVDLYASSGTIKYAFDTGGGFGSYTTIAITPGSFQQFPLAGVPGGAFKMRVEVVSGDVVMHGPVHKNTANGVRVHKLGKGGTHSGTWANEVNRAAMIAGLGFLAPHAYTWMLGVNDQWLAGSQDAPTNTPAQYKTNGAEIVDRCRTATPSSDILLVTSPEVRVEGYRMSVYAEAWRSLAVELECSHMDASYFFGERLSQYEYGSTRALLDDSFIHPSSAGGYVLVDAFLQALQTATPLKETLL